MLTTKSKPDAAAGPRTKKKQRQFRGSTKKKLVAVDQYMVHTLLDEIPARMPHRSERLPQPDTLPALVQKTPDKKYYCEVCHVMCSSFTTLKHHQAGRSHRKHVLMTAINSSRLLFSTVLFLNLGF